MGIVKDWMMFFLHVGWGRILQILSQQLHTHVTQFYKRKGLMYTIDAHANMYNIYIYHMIGGSYLPVT